MAACPVLGEVLAVVIVAGSLAFALIVLAVILGGSDKAVERVFRLLRWVTNRPEPAAPAARDPGARGEPASSAAADRAVRLSAS